MLNARLSSLREKLKDIADGVIVTNEKNIRYFCGFDYTDGCLIISQSRALLLCDFRYIEAARKEADPDFEVIMTEGKRSAWLPDILKELNVDTLAFEDNFMTVKGHELLSKDCEGVCLVPLGNVLTELREYKDEDETENIIKAQRIAEAAFEHILGFINSERTEREIALELEFEMRRLGASGVSFDTIAVSGKASSMPHGVPRDCRLEKGFLTLDFGAVYNGYCSDMTRTLCIGKADDEMKKVYNTVLHAQLKAIEEIHVGMLCSQADAVARTVIDNAGYRGCFGHSLGHGVGMDIHEAPNLSPYAKEKTLCTGHVVTCEPGIYIEGKYGVRIEDMLVFRGNRVEDITKTSKDLIEIY